MILPMEILIWVLSFVGTGILTGIGFILKSLSTQGSALAILVARVGNINPAVVDRRLHDLETDMARVWGLYDAWRGPSSPDVRERMDHR